MIKKNFEEPILECTQWEEDVITASGTYQTEGIYDEFWDPYQ